jgi:hypothetical protein
VTGVEVLLGVTIGLVIAVPLAVRFVRWIYEG